MPVVEPSALSVEPSQSTWPRPNARTTWLSGESSVLNNP